MYLIKHIKLKHHFPLSPHATLGNKEEEKSIETLHTFKLSFWVH